MRIRLGMIIAGGFLMGSPSIGVCAWRLPIDARPAMQEQTQTQSQTQGTQQDSVAEAARKAREKAKANANAAPAKKTYTNDNVPALRVNEISVLTANPNAEKDAAADATKAAEVKAEPKKDEAYWRKRFADARTKLALAQKDLDVSQRELNLLQTQYYSDPNKALQQQLTRDDINAKTAKVDEKKQQVADLTQAIEDLKDELRRSGGEPGWANPPSW
jgi:chromosome segregation ATPase